MRVFLSEFSVIENAVATVPSYGTVDDEATVPSMVICVSISVWGIGAFKMSVPFRGEILD